MEWVNIHAPTVRAPEYIGSDPTARATWFNVLVYCCEQENGGRIVGGALWKDRQWQQTCGVTLREVKNADPLLTIEGNDVIVWKYPIEKEREVQRLRDMGRSTSEKKANAARQNGNLGGRPKTQLETERETQLDEPNGQKMETQHNPSKPIEGNGREWKGKRREGTGSLALDSASDPTLSEFLAECQKAGIPDDFARDKFLAKQEQGGFGRKWKPYVQRIQVWYREKSARERGVTLKPTTTPPRLGPTPVEAAAKAFFAE